MKQNMKKSMIMTIIYCMGLGCLTLFIGALYPAKTSDDLSEAIEKDSYGLHDTKIDNEDLLNEMPGKALASMVAATPVPTLAPTATPTPPPTYEWSEGGYPEIEKFFNDYYVAWNSCDYNLITSLTTDSNNSLPLVELQKETRFLDDIRDITCYITKSYEEGAYIVYVYYEMKYVNIKTTLPRLDKFYLITDKEGGFKINTSEMDDILNTYYEERDQDLKIKEIRQMANAKSKEALEKDMDLQLYVEALYGN